MLPTHRIRALADASRTFAEASLDLNAVLASVAHHVAGALGDACFIDLLGGGASEVYPAGTARSDLPVTLASPLRVQRQVIGHVTVGRRRADHPFSEEDQAMLAELVDRAAMAIQSAQLYAELERRVAERTTSLQASELRFRSVAESAHDAIISADAQGDVTYSNGAAAAIFGYRDDELLGRPLTDLMPARFRDAHCAGLARSLATGRPHVIGRTVELVGLRRDGTEFPIELSLSSWPLRGETFFTGILRDISQRHRADRLRAAQFEVTKALAESPSLAGAIPEIVRAVCQHLQWDVGNVWLVDGDPPTLRCVSIWAPPELADGAFVHASRAHRFEPGVGLPGRIWSSGVAAGIVEVASDPNFPRAAYAVEDGLHVACGFPILAGGDIVGVVECFARQARAPDPGELEVLGVLGSQIGQFVQRKRAEDALRAEHERFIEAEAIAHLGSWEWDVVADRVTWSAELYRIHGLVGERDVTFADWVASIHPEDRDRITAVIQGCFADGQPFAFEQRLVRPTGEVRTLACRGRLVRDELGRPARMAGTTQDISERKQIEAKLMVADRMASVGTLAAGVAHEINNPLAYVLSNLELIVEQVRELASGSPSGRLTELADMAVEARHGAERVRKIVRGLKAFSRADDEQRVPLDVRAVLETAINMSFNELRHRARLIKDFGPVPVVEADEARLGQVFINLLVNAAQALPDGHADLHQIHVVTRTSDSGAAVIEVHDTGPGIAPELLGRIFDPFFTTKPIGTGTGLGLSICHGIVSDLHGEIVVESTPGHGATFRITLPGAAALPVSTVHGQPHRVLAGRRGRVLVIDDDPIIGTSLGRILRDHDVIAVRSGRAALAHLAEDRDIDVILCDVMMPEMTGMELHAELARIAPHLIDRMVFITGGAFVPRARAFLEELPNERLEKPFDLHTLRSLVRRFTRR